MLIDKAVILAAGRGSRMRRRCEGAVLTENQERAASFGLKAMIPVGRPFIDYILSSLGDAGYRRVCLVVAPDHQVLREHCLRIPGGRLHIEFAVQREPLGTAHALASACDFVAEDEFLLINSDNYYPTSALARLRSSTVLAVAGFKPEGLCQGNISPGRLRNYAIMVGNSEGLLAQLIEKPGEEFELPTSEFALINMNCWRFNCTIFEACRSIPKSHRGEYELTDAVSYGIKRLGMRIHILEINEPALDLSTRADISEVTAWLKYVEVCL